MLTRLVSMLAATLFFCEPAISEPVFVRSGVSEGQGWAFQDAAGCWLATPKHVLKEGSGILMSGPDGLQGLGGHVSYHPDPEIDLAIVEIIGDLAKQCPPSSLGDRDTRPVLKRVLAEGRTISLERRIGDIEGGDYGTEIRAVEVLAITDTDPVFSIRALNENDAIFQGDSGSTVRLRGQGVGQAGLPLGLLINAYEGYGTAIRMDVIRNFHEGNSSASALSQSSGANVSASVDRFTGRMDSSECNPVNVLLPAAPCGWRVSRESAYDRPELVLKLSRLTAIKNVVVKYDNVPDGTYTSFATSKDGQNWTGDRPCTSAANIVSCSMGEREATFLRIKLEANPAEVLSVQILE